MRLNLEPDPWRFWGISLLLMALATPLFVWSVGIQSLDGCDESFYAQIAREMMASGQWLSPTFLGELFFEKPPLLMWLMTLSYHVGGINVWTARLPGILCALGSIPLMGWIGRHYLSQRATILGMMILPLCYLWVQQGRIAGQDIPLTFIELVGIAALVTGIHGSTYWFFITGLALGLGILMKSAMILLVGAALIPYLIVNYRRWSLSWPFWAGLASGVGVFGSWLGISIQTHGWQVWDSLIGKVQDLGATPFHTSNNWLYYLWHIPAHGFPWTILALLGAGILIRFKRGSSVLIWSLPLILFLELEIYATRTHYYTLQLYPWLALLAGVSLDYATRCWRERGMDLRQPAHLAQWISWCFFVIGLGILGLGLAVIFNVSGLEELTHHGVALVIIGLLYLSLIAIWHQRQWVQHLAGVWMGCLLLAGVVTILSIVSRADFGNFNPTLAAFQSQWSQVLPTSPVIDIGNSGLADVCEAQAHAFYTPNPGKWVRDRELLQGNHRRYLWVSPVQWEHHESDLTTLQTLVELEGWQLMEDSGS